MVPRTWSDEWKRTNPDIVVYLPEEENSFDATNQHFLVLKSPSGAWLAFWTCGADEAESNQSVVISRSTDRGLNWSERSVIDGPLMNDRCFRAPDQRQGAWRASGSVINEDTGKKFSGVASWGFPILAPTTNRVYCFYFKCKGTGDLSYGHYGVLTGKYSEDDGITWSEPFEMPTQRVPGDNPDVNVPGNWIIWQIPYITSSGEVIAPFTCWNSVKSSAGIGSESYFMRFDNILTEIDPTKLTMTVLSGTHRGLRVPGCSERNPCISFCEEPAIVELSDGRFFCVMRTDAGYIAYSVSSDQCRTWSTPAPLYRDNDGEIMLNPVMPCPIWKLKDGRYLILYANNKGDANGGHFPCSYDCVRMNRYPAFLSVGHENLVSGYCPIRFGPPRAFLDTQGIGIGPGGRTEVGSYSSLLEDGDDRIVFYPDRKHFLLGKRLTNAWLADCEP